MSSDWLMNVSLPAKMVQAATRVEVVYHTSEGRFVEVLKDRHTGRLLPENVEEPTDG